MCFCSRQHCHSVRCLGQLLELLVPLGELVLELQMVAGRIVAADRA